MTLRLRLTVLTAAAVALAVAFSSVAIYVATQRQLLDQIDDTLRDRMLAVLVPARIAEERGVPREVLPRLGAPGGYTQLVSADGEVQTTLTGEGELPPTDAAISIASGESRGPAFETVSVAGDRVRVLTERWQPGFVVQVARPLDEVDDTLARLRSVLILVTIGAAALAGGLGALTSRVVIRPVKQLTATAERVTETRDLTERIDESGSDEIARLGRAFNTMLAALDESLRSQRGLVADASHELRTPLTSIRTNIELLSRTEGLSDEDRAELTSAIDAQIVDLSDLVGDVIELGRGSDVPALDTDVRLDEVVARSVVRAEAHWPRVAFAAALDPTVVRGEADRIARAADNLLDNAGKWSPDDGTVTVSVAGGVLEVADEGVGVAPQDAPFVFDRFWRSAEARRLPGSGLGLAIVKQVADRHGAEVSVSRAPGGGALFRVVFPDAVNPDRI